MVPSRLWHLLPLWLQLDPSRLWDLLPLWPPSLLSGLPLLSVPWPLLDQPLLWHQFHLLVPSRLWHLWHLWLQLDPSRLWHLLPL